jgi:hypothetical protein
MAFGANYYLLTSLPTLTRPGVNPPVSLGELRARVAYSDAAPLVDVVLLSDDLRQRQAVLAGEPVHTKGVVLTPDQVAGKAPLPGPLDVEEADTPGRLPEDLVWEAYWRHAVAVARRRRSRFLGAWARVEVALRNGVAAVRAEALGESAERNLVAKDLAATEAMVDRAVAAWSDAADPLKGWRTLVYARWNWAVREEPRFSFDKDEVTAYAVKLLLLRDWRRTMGAAA